MKLIPFKDFFKLFLMKSKEKSMENDFLTETDQNQQGRPKKNWEKEAKIQSAMNVSKRKGFKPYQPWIRPWLKESRWILNEKSQGKVALGPQALSFLGNLSLRSVGNQRGQLSIYTVPSDGPQATHVQHNPVMHWVPLFDALWYPNSKIKLTLIFSLKISFQQVITCPI